MINCPACSPFLKKGINGHLTALCLAEASIHQGYHLLIVGKPSLFRCRCAHLQDVTAEGPCFCIVPCRSAPLSFWSRCRTLPSPRGGLVAFAICLCLRAGPPHPREQKKTARARIREPTKKLPPPPKKKSQGPDPCTAKKKKRKGEWSNRLLHSCCIRALMHCFDDKNSFLCMWNSLAFDSRARIWFYARHRNFVGLTYFVFSVDLSFRADADWSSSCTEIAGLWTHVHSFPLAAFDDCVGVAFLVLFGFFWFCLFGSLRLYVYFLSPSLATAITLSRAPAEEKKATKKPNSSRFGDHAHEHENLKEVEATSIKWICFKMKLKLESC